MKNIIYSSKLTELLKSINFEVLTRHYNNNIEYFSYTKHKYNSPTVWNINMNLDTFKNNFLNKPNKDFDNLFDCFEDNTNVYYFECFNPKPYIIAFQSDSEEELLKLFDPKIMVLV